MTLSKLNSTWMAQSTGTHRQKMPERPPTWRNFNSGTLFPISVSALLLFYFFANLLTICLWILYPQVFCFPLQFWGTNTFFFIWLAGFYSKLFSQQWTALVVDESSCRSGRGMKALFAERESERVYRLSNNAWVSWYEGNLAVNCRSRGSHDLFL